jgi:ribosomal protein L11 methyltransferase
VKYIEARVTYDHSDPELAGDLIAGVFFDFDLQGVVIEDPGLETREDWAEDAVARPARHAVVGYLAKDERLDLRRADLEKQIARMGNHKGLIYRISYRELDEENWAEAWKAFFWPHKIGRQVVVKPSWRDYSAMPEEVVIELDPGMAFGTGTHPTTALSVQLIEAHLQKGDAFLDIGTGSGILMAAAGKLGAGILAGSDRDELAVRIAAENLGRNGFKEDRFILVQGLLAAPFKGAFECVAANILADIILDLLDDIPRVLKNDGIFICSGIIAEKQNLVAGKMKNMGFEIVEIRLKEGWVAIAGRRPGSGL